MRRPDAAPGLGFFLGALVILIGFGASVHAQTPFATGLRTIAGVRLEGRHQIPAKEIWAVLKTKRPSRLPWHDRAVVRLDFLNADARAIERICQFHGFLDARVDHRLGVTQDPGAVLVTFVIQEGPRSRVGTVEFEGMKAISPQSLVRRLYLKRGRPFNPAGMIVDTARISAAYKERGMLPHVSFGATRDSLDVTVRYSVDEGPVYRIGAVHLPAPQDLPVRERLVRRELLLRPGDIYRASRVQRSLERLYETGLFNQVAIVPYPESSNTLVEFDVQLRARKFRWIDAGVGSGTAERFRLTGEWGQRNLYGRGLQGALGGRLAFDGEARFLVARVEATLLDPWLLRSRTRGSVALSHEDRRDRADPRWVVRQRPEGVKFQLRRDLGRFARVALTQDNLFVQQDIKVKDTTAVAPDSLARRYYTTHLVQLSMDRDTRDHPLAPSRGSTQAIAAQVAGGPFRGTSSFTKGEVVSTWYTPLRTDWVFATRLRAGIIGPFGTAPDFSPADQIDSKVASVPLEDRFRIGGVNSLRGYNENEIPLSGGLAVIQANAEMRIPVVGPFGIEVFLDAGNAWARPSYIKMEDFTPRRTHRPMDSGDVRYVFGIGARVQLPIGPLRVDLSWSPRPDDRGRWLKATPQFAIGPSF